AATKRILKRAGYRTFSTVVDMTRLGVPQARRRFILVASRHPSIDPKTVTEKAIAAFGEHRARTVRWAIGDLIGLRNQSNFDSASSPTAINARRIARLFRERLFDLPNRYRPKCHRGGDHSYVSVYGRLRWNQPAQTITTGFGCMGQGRYVHPQRQRTIT